jgi:hypothetical protein
VSADSERAARLFTAVVVAACGACVAWTWLPAPWTEKELAAAASRVWDVRRELAEHGTVPWWTPWFMGGTPYTLLWAQGLPLAAWLGLSFGLPLAAAGKAVALLAVGASAIAMYACARRLLGSPWAAALAAVAYALHPQQAFRAGGDEHVGLSVAFALVPLAWLGWTRATQAGTLAAAFRCALALAALLWTSGKHAAVLVGLLALATAIQVWAGGWPAVRPAVRGAALVLALTAGLGAFSLVPAAEESRHARLFAGEDVAEWRRQLSFRSLLGPIDRDGALTRGAIAAAPPLAVPDAAERAARQRLALLKFESGAKYAGGVLLALAAAAGLGARRRAAGALFPAVAAAFGAALALATVEGVAPAHLRTLHALFAVPGVPPGTRAAAVAVPLLVAAFAGALAWRRRFAAAAAVVAFAVVPLFPAAAALPGMGALRAPFVFWDIPATFCLCLLAACFVTDVVAAGPWRARTPGVVAALAALVLADHAPAARVMAPRPDAARTAANVEAAYRAVGAERAPGKTYYVSTRNQHLLGPLASGRPQAYEAWTKWTSPLGAGLLNDRSWYAAAANRAYLDLVGARWIVFDKGDAELMASGLARQMLAFYRGWFAVRLENDDVVLFENPTAWPWLSLHTRAPLFLGDVRRSPDVALAVAARRLPLVHQEAGAPDVPEARAFAVAGVYVDSDAEARLAALPALRPLAVPLRGGSVPLPEPADAVRALEARRLRRRNGAVELAVDLPERGLVVVGENYHPHWRATVDGRVARVERVSTSLLGLELPAGPHDLRLEFRTPPAYALAGLTSLLVLAGGLAALLGARRAATRARPAGAAAPASR